MNNSEGQTQEPVGWMEEVAKTIILSIDHYREAGRDDKFNVQSIADYLKRCFAPPPPAPIKTEGEDEWGNGWDSAITFANNLCVQISDDYNNSDMVSQADTSTYCAQQIRKAYGDRSFKPEEMFPASIPQSSTEDDDEGWIYCPNCGRVKAEQ